MANLGHHFIGALQNWLKETPMFGSLCCGMSSEIQICETGRNSRCQAMALYRRWLCSRHMIAAKTRTQQ
jgi:hypothetical protein